jgi:MFS family permease
MSEDEDQLETTSTLLLTGASQSISDTIIDRFTGAIAVAAGATVAESGLINGGRQLGLNLPQVLFGGLADKYGKRRVIAGGRLLSSLTLAAMVFVNTPGWLLPLIIATSVCTSMVIPSWGSLLGDYSGSTKRGTVITRINSVAQAGGFAAMIIAFAVTFTQTGPMTKSSFNLLLAIASAASLVSAILVGYTKENPPRKDRTGFELGLLFSDVRLMRFLTLSFVFGIGAAVAMPFFSFITVGKLHMTVWQIALSAVANLACNMLSQRLIGRVMDKLGRRPVIIFSRVATASSCFVYAFATDWLQIVAVEAFIGIALAAWLSGQSTYILDLAPQRLRATYLAMSMTAVGVSTFIGSYTTGALAQTYLVGLGYEGISLGLLVGGVLRFSLGLLFFTSYETKPEN